MIQRGRLLVYSRYQLLDYLRERGGPLVLIGLIIGWGTLVELRMRLGSGWTQGADASTVSFMAIRGLLSQLAFFAALLSVAGIVSNDRKHGYFRLLFAKPVGVLRYYVQAFVVSWFGALMVVAFLLGIWALLTAPVSPWGVMRALTLQFWVVGTTGFLMSTLVKWDWVATAVIWGGSEILRQVYRDESSFAGWMVMHFTAPTHIIGALRESLFLGYAPARAPFMWALVYGAVCMALALVVLKKRPLAL